MRDRAKKPSEQKWLIAIVTLGFLLRLAFLLKGATIYYGAGQEHLNGDSFSFTRSFLNLWHTGHYTLEPLIPDASFGRLPGYPFFYGLHYLLFGPELVLQALSGTQLLLDTAVIWLLYKMLRRWTGQARPARLVALLYATYPFAIIWITIVGTETLNTFCTVLWLSVITRPFGSRKHYVLVGVLVVVAFYVREYMGALLPVSLLFVAVWPSRKAIVLPRWQRIGWVLLGFTALYAWWPIRNYTNHSQIVLVKPASAGYANQREDMQAYLDWLHCWTNDNTTWVEGLVQDKPLRYPSQIFGDPTEERRVYALTKLAARCGGSFHLRRLDTHDYRLVLPARFRNCNPQIAAGFDSLRQSYVRRQPLNYAVAVPLANLRKAFFKSATIHEGTSAAKTLVQRGLFAYRTLLLLLGVAGAILGWRQRQLWPVIVLFGFLYLYISFCFRSLEMRYLLQADVLLLLPAAGLLLSRKKAQGALVRADI